MRRRQILAAVGGAVCGLGGCVGFGDGDGQETLTQVPPPTGTPEQLWATPQQDCPAVPSNAEVYKCTTGSDDGLSLGTDGENNSDGAAVALTLSNGSDVRFVTGRDWWTLARKEGDWTIIEQGNGSDRRIVPPGDIYRWQIDATGGDTEDNRTTVRASLTSGRYAFAVTGHATVGELTAVVTTFAV